MPDAGTFVGIFIFSLSGVINAALLLSTRRDLFISRRTKPTTAINVQMFTTTSFGTKDMDSDDSRLETNADESATTQADRSEGWEVAVTNRPRVSPGAPTGEAL